VEKDYRKQGRIIKEELWEIYSFRFWTEIPATFVTSSSTCIYG